MTWFLAAAAMLGSALMVLGLRGRRVDDHPICRKCRFDLVGLYPGVGVCPECGTRVRAVADDASSRRVRKAIRVGNRRRRRAPIVAGAVTLLVSTTLLVAQLTRVDWDSLKPFPVLTAELRLAVNAKNTVRADELLSEILNRVQTKRLDAARLMPLVRTALDLQADQNAPWTQAWGDLIDAYDAAVGLGPDQRTAYFSNCVQLSFEMSQSVRVGDAVPVRLVYNRSRLGATREIHAVQQILSGAIAGHPFSGPGYDNHSLYGSNRSNSFGPMGVDVGSPGLVPGTYPITFTIQYTLGDSLEYEWRDWLRNWAQYAESDAQSVVVFTRTVEKTIQLVPRDDSDITLVAASSPDEIRSHFEVSRVWASRTADAQVRLEVPVRITSPPYPVFIEVVCRQSEQEWTIGMMGLDPGAELPFISVYSPTRTGHVSRLDTGTLWVDAPADFDAQAVDIVIRPSLDAARRKIDMHAIWDVGEIVFENVPVIWLSSDPGADPHADPTDPP